MTSDKRYPERNPEDFDDQPVGREAPRHPWRNALKVVGAAAAVVTAVAAVWAIRDANDLQNENNSLQRAAQNSHLEEQMMSLDAHFVSHPRLRRFFYATLDGHHADLPRRGLVRAQALSTAEMIIDFADDIGAYIRVSKMNNQDGDRWVAMMRSYFDESRVVRVQWQHFNATSADGDAPYDAVTACVLGAPQGAALEHWNWRTGEPRAKHPRGCSG